MIKPIILVCGYNFLEGNSKMESDGVDSLFTVAPIACGGLCLVLVLLFISLNPSRFAII